MSEPGRHTHTKGRRQRGSSQPATAGIPGHGQGTPLVGHSSDISETPSPVVEGSGFLAIPKPLHRELKTEASRQGLKLNEFVIPHLRLLVAKTVEEGGRA